MSVNLDNSAPLASVKQEPAPVYSKWRVAFAVMGEPLWVVVCMFGFALIPILFAIKLLPGLTGPSETTIGQLIVNASVYLLGILFVLLPLLFNETRRKSIRSLLGLDKRPYLNGVAWALSAFIVYFWVTVVVAFVASLIPGFDSEQAQEVGFDDITTTAGYIMAFIGLVILPPIFEEILFRGYLFGRLRKYTGFWVSTLVTSVAFGFVHGQWNVGLDTFVLSLFLCFLRERTGSLWAPIILHATKNGLAYFFLFIAPVMGFNLL